MGGWLPSPFGGVKGSPPGKFSIIYSVLSLGHFFHALNNDCCFVHFLQATYRLNCLSVVNEHLFFQRNLDI